MLIKTLPHLVPAHVAQANLHAYTTTYTPQLLRYFQGLALLTKEHTTFPKLVAALGKSEWTRVNTPQMVEEYAIRGDIVDIWPAGYTQPIRLEFFGDELEHMYLFDPALGRKVHTLPFIVVGLNEKLSVEDSKQVSINIDNTHHSLTAGFLTPFLPGEIDPGIEVITSDYAYPQLFWSKLDLLQAEIHRLQDLDYHIYIYTKHADALPQELLKLINQDKDKSHNELVQNLPADLAAGVLSVKEKLAVFTDREIFGTIYLSQRKEASGNIEKLLRQLEGEISVGDFVVHEDHGVAIYAGLTQEQVGNEVLEYLELQYAGDDRLLVPLNQVHKLTRYIGNDGLAPELNRLGKSTWQTLQTKVKQSVMILARELVEHLARRELAKATPVNADDSKEYAAFVDKFTYEATEDQIRAINEVIFDMQQTKPMNRLLIGDVGFGKTEIMLRAAFKAVEAGMQVAVLCPTTVLASQHYAVFSERFAGSKYKIASFSRFQSEKQNAAGVDLLNLGDIDIAIGTHRLLSKDVKFANLGLLIVDEEQRFGVKQKERIKQLNYGVHHLSVSATPIPRTLSMALSSIQEISIMAKPPKGRRAIKTELIKKDWDKVAKALHTEIERGGQIYFVHNEVRDIDSLKVKLDKLLPGVGVIVGHGQMSPHTLDKAMTDFYQHKADVLLCTTIIENGLDMPNVNTIIVHKAERFGLSQLYQLRGRVGRSDKQAYCYLFYDQSEEEMAETAQIREKHDLQAKPALERLQALLDASELGAGFHIASRDLEIRGAGDLLGEKQSGHISKLGYALYMQLLAAEIERLKSQDSALARQPEYVTL